MVGFWPGVGVIVGDGRSQGVAVMWISGEDVGPMTSGLNGKEQARTAINIRVSKDIVFRGFMEIN